MARKIVHSKNITKYIRYPNLYRLPKKRFVAITFTDRGGKSHKLMLSDKEYRNLVRQRKEAIWRRRKY